MTPIDWALAYVERLGWPVFPRPNGKFLKGGHGFKDATRDVAQIREWWTRWPDAWPSIPTGPVSGIVILDIDNKHGKNGFDTLADLGKTLPDTPMVYTPHSGLHLYLADNQHISIRCSTGELGPGLDVKGHGGSVPLPCPGNGYTWDTTLKPHAIPFRVAPSWLAHKAVKRRENGELSATAVLRRSCDLIRSAQPGERNEVLNRQAFLVGTLVRTGALALSEALHELKAAAGILVARTNGNGAKAEYDLNRAFQQGLGR